MINKCLFPVAGYGTRFLPATKSMPKEMLPIVNKPLIQYGVEEAVSAGMSGMAFVTGRGKRAIPDHFDYSYELETEISGSGKEEFLKETRALIDRCTFSYTRQRFMKGLESMHDVDFGGFAVSYSPTNHNGSMYVDLTIIGREAESALTKVEKIIGKLPELFRSNHTSD